MRPYFKLISEQLKSFLTFNYAERRGIMVLVMLILLVEAVNAFLPVMIQKETFDTADFVEDIRQFEIALSQADTLVKETYKKPQTSKTQFPNYTIKKKAGPAKPPIMIEINTADSAQLVGLYGIGAVFAERILKYRGLLGGFFKTEQLLEVYGMDSVRYDQIKGHISVDPSLIKKLSVNEAEFKALLHHPYLDYETVKAIFNYRQYTGLISSQDTLRAVIGYDPMFEKIRHYVEYRVTSKEQ